MPNDVLTIAEYLSALINAIVENRIDAKEFAQMTDEQRVARTERLILDEKAAIEEGLARHEKESE